MYLPILFHKSAQNTKSFHNMIKKYKDNDELKDLLFIYKNPYIVYRKLDFNPKGQLLQKNKHNEFIENFFAFIDYRIDEEQMKDFLYSCDIHSQHCYINLINNSYKVGVKKEFINKYMKNVYPQLPILKIAGVHKFNTNSAIVFPLDKRGSLVTIVKHKDRVLMRNRNRNFYHYELSKSIQNLPVESAFIFGNLYKDKLNVFVITTTTQIDKVRSYVEYVNYRKYLRQHCEIIDPAPIHDFYEPAGKNFLFLNEKEQHYIIA